LEKQEQMGNPVLVAEIDRTVVGFASYGDFRDSRRWPGYRFTVEHTIHVAGERQGAGIGRALLDALMSRAISNGKHVMIGAIDAENTGSITFHQKMGFVEVARMPELGFKFDRWLDLVLMERRFD
jgi:phosphinothricin acetyltransferase